MGKRGRGRTVRKCDRRTRRSICPLMPSPNLRCGWLRLTQSLEVRRQSLNRLCLRPNSTLVRSKCCLGHSTTPSENVEALHR